MNDQTQAILQTLVSLIIPASAEDNLPGADDLSIFSNIVTHCDQRADFVLENLSTLEQTAQTKFEQSFVDLSGDAQMRLVDALGRDSAFFTFLVTTVVQCYYQDARVLQSLEMDPRPPFPQGHEIEQGDWSLLEPVRSRKIFYRDVS